MSYDSAYTESLASALVSNLVNISEAASLGLHTMALLARHSEQRCTNQEIAHVLKGSSHHLAKVMQRLVRVGLVDSIRGPQGGFRLARPAEQITLLEIYEAVEGPLQQAGCLSAEPVCRGKSCLLGRTVQAIHEQLRNFLGETSLLELAESLSVSVTIRQQGTNG